MRASSQNQSISTQTGIRQRSLRKHCRLGRATELVFVMATGAMLVLSGGAQAQDVNNSGTASNAGTIDNLTNTGGTFTNTGTVTNSTTVTGGTVDNTTGTLTGATAVAATGTLNSAGTLTGLVTNNGGAVNITGGTAVTLTNTAGVLAITGGAVSGLVTNDATGSSTVTIDSLTNNTGGTFTNTGNVTNATTVTGGTVTMAAGALSTASTVTVNGGILEVDSGTVGAVTVGGGTLDIDGGTVASLNLDDGTDHTISGSGTVTGVTTIDNGTLVQTGVNSQLGTDGTTASTVTVGSGGDYQANEGIAGDVTNSGGTITAADTTFASLINTSGTVTIAAGKTLQAESLRNDGTLTIGDGATFTGTGNTFNNAGIATIANGGSIIDAGAINNLAGGTLTFAGLATVNADSNSVGGEIVTNAGTFIVNSATNSTASIGNDAFTNLGTGTIAVNGTATLDGITTLTNSSTSTNAINIATGATLEAINLNSSAGTITVAGSLDAATGITGGTLTINGGTVASLTNSGTVKVTGTTATVSNNVLMTAGTLDLQSDGVATTDLMVMGDADLSGTILVDVDLSDGSTDGDTITVNGNLSGLVDLSFNNVASSAGNISNIELFKYNNSSSLKFSDSGLPTNGQFLYFVDDETDNIIQLKSMVNTGIANLAATVGLTQTVVGAIVNRPTSPFVSDYVGDKSEDACGAGGWARATGGRADAEGSYTDVTSKKSATTPVSLSYSGLQMGSDFACFGGHYNGWDMSFGGIGGFNKGSSSNNVFDIDFNTGLPTSTLLSVTNTDIKQVYGGLYMTAARGRFFSDLQYRYDKTEYTSNNTEVVADRGFDLNNSVYDSKGQTLSGSVGYSWPIGKVEGLNFVSSIGFALTDRKTDTIDLGDDGSLKINDSKSQIGFVSATIAKSKVLPDEITLLSYFGTVTYYDDFADDPTAVFTTPSATTRDITLSSIGSYAELSAGVNAVRLLSPGDAGNARQLNVAVRVDARIGEDVESWGIAGQLRLQF